MNATTRTIHYSGFMDKTLSLTNLAKHNMILLVFLLGVIFSALALIYVKDQGRRLINEVELLNQERINLQIQHDRLLLEQSAWATQSRLQVFATEHLGMQMPAAKSIQTLQGKRLN